ncbi:hypothetical protein CEXT_268251, partial [Caerostris extrusa]
NLSGSVLRGDVTCHNTGEGDVGGDLSGGGDIAEVSGILWGDSWLREFGAAAPKT